jgi:hypothetical protein
MKELHPNLDREEFYEKTIRYVRNISKNDDEAKEKDVLEEAGLEPVSNHSGKSYKDLVIERVVERRKEL